LVIIFCCFVFYFDIVNHSQAPFTKNIFIMSYVNVNGAIRDLSQLTRQLTGKQLAIGISRGINKTLLKGRTTARSAVKAEYNIPQKYLSGIGYNKSFPSTLTGSIYASAKPIPMDAFNPKFQTSTQNISVSRRGQQRVSDRKGKGKLVGNGVSIEVHKGKRETVPYAFMIVGAKPRVFARGFYRIGSFGFTQRHTRLENSSGNDSVKPLISTTVHAAVINPKSIQAINTRIRTAFPKDLEHELLHLISNLNK
jgi:hypothetical protein